MWFSGDGDQVLAAEPGDHGATPCQGACVVIGHFPFRFDHGLRVSADPVENLVSACQGPGFGAVVEVGLGGREAAEAAARPGVVEMDDGADERQEFGDLRDGQVGIESRANGAFEGADAVFDGSVVGRVADGAVEWEDAVGGEEVIEDGSVEWRAVVALEQEWRAMTGAKPLEPSEVVEGGFGVEDERIEVEVRCEVAGEDDHHAGIGGRGAQVEGVDGPGEVGQVPGDVGFRVADSAEVAAAQPRDD